jgi:hypothetical protein
MVSLQKQFKNNISYYRHLQYIHLLDGEQKEDLYCNSSSLYLRKIPGKARKSMKKHDRNIRRVEAWGNEAISGRKIIV